VKPCGETVHFQCMWTPPWSFPRRALCRDGVLHANPTSPPSSSPSPASSSPTPASSSVAVVRLWPKVSTPSRSSHRFLSVLLFPCTFGVVPTESLPFFLSLSLFCVYSQPTRYVRVPALEPPRRSTAGRRHLRQVMRDAEPHPEGPCPRPEVPRSAAREAWAAGRRPPPPARFGCLLHRRALVSTPTHSPRPPLPIPTLIQAPRGPNRRRFETTQELLYAMNTLCVPLQRKKMTLCFSFRPLKFLVIFRSFYVSCTFYGKPSRIIPPFAHKSHPTLLQI
jgi:hypothetical protein